MSTPTPTYPRGRSTYNPRGRRAMSAPSPQTDPDAFSVEDIRAEIAYLVATDKRHGAHFLRAEARVKLYAEIAKRTV